MSCVVPIHWPLWCLITDDPVVVYILCSVNFLTTKFSGVHLPACLCKSTMLHITGHGLTLHFSLNC